MEKNKIITISGQPVSGKSTAVKEIIRQLEEQGYSKSDIHVISTGYEFRSYYNSIIEFIKNFENKEEIEKLSENPYLKELIGNKEYRNVLINIISKLRAKNINIEELTIEQANAKEFDEITKIIDVLIDTNIFKKGKEINSILKPKEIWIVDSRLAFHNIPESFSVRLITSPEIAAERLYKDGNRGKEDKYVSKEEALKARENRRKLERERYIKRYNVDLEDENNYNLIIDTSYSTVEDVANTIITCLKCYSKNKPYSKKWVSPKTLLPLQNERDTIGCNYYDLNEMTEVIKEQGYDPGIPIEIIEVDGYRYIIEGHHRNFASARLKKTLVPVEIIGRDNDNLIYGGANARERAESLRDSYLFGHEWMIDEKFSYRDVYPDIYKRFEKEISDD